MTVEPSDGSVGELLRLADIERHLRQQIEATQALIPALTRLAEHEMLNEESSARLHEAITQGAPFMAKLDSILDDARREARCEIGRALSGGP